MMVKCEKCGKEMLDFFLSVFNRDGSDSEYNYPIFDVPENAVYVETTQHWTGYGLSEDEQAETIKCPHCGQFPFIDREVQVYEIVRVVCFKGGMQEAEVPIVHGDCGSLTPEEARERLMPNLGVMGVEHEQS